MAIKEWYSDELVSENLFGRVCVEFDDDTSKATQTITMRLKFKSIKTQYMRKRVWTIKFYIDGVTKKIIEKQLPDNNTSEYVASENYVHITPYNWCNWCEPYQVTLPNDGKAHTFKIEYSPHLLPGTPASVLNSDLINPNALSMTRTMPSPKVAPTEPKPKDAKFDGTTRKISYNWDETVPSAFMLIHRTLYDEAGTVITEGWFKDTDGTTNRKLYNKDKDTTRVQEVIPENVAKIVWFIRNYSASNHWIEGNTLTTDIDTYSKVWIKVDGQWKKAIFWVKIGREPDSRWRQVSKTYVKVGSSWEPH